MQKKYNCLFLDFDRTFWDVDINQQHAQLEVFDMFAMHKYFPSFEAYYSIFRTINESLWIAYRDKQISREYLRNYRFEYLLNEAGIHNQTLALEMSNAYLQITPKYNALLPHSKEILEYLVAKYPLHLVTNGFNEVQAHKVAQSGLAQYFKNIITSEIAGANKPDPIIFSYALKKANTTPEKTMMIGDDIYSDIYGATKAGIDTIFLNTNKIYHEQQPTFEVYSLIEIKAIL